jgi:hypothetical protein
MRSFFARSITFEYITVTPSMTPQTALTPRQMTTTLTDVGGCDLLAGV